MPLGTKDMCSPIVYLDERVDMVKLEGNSQIGSRIGQLVHKYSPDSSLAEKGGDAYSLGSAPSKGKKPGKLVYKLQTWMSTLDDETPLSALSIPGTHDSCAYTTTWPFISTQNLSIKAQLYAGIRYFDFRCGLIKDELEMVHGTATLGLKLSEVLETVYAWLDAHQSEGLIIQIKQDRKSDNSTLSFSEAVVAIISKDQHYWRTWCTTPALGALRGRIQLFRRFTAESRGLATYGINVTRWQDNPELPFTIHTWPGNVALTIQDHYSFSSPESLPNAVLKKGGDISSTLSLAINDPDPEHWYINFTSAFEFNVYYQVNPRQIALGGYHLFRWIDGINIRLFGTLKTLKDDCEEGVKKRLGVVVMDFPELPEEELIGCVVDSNFPAPPEKPGDGDKDAWMGRMGLSLFMVSLFVVLYTLLSIVAGYVGGNLLDLILSVIPDVTCLFNRG